MFIDPRQVEREGCSWSGMLEEWKWRRAVLPRTPAERQQSSNNGILLLTVCDALVAGLGEYGKCSRLIAYERSRVIIWQDGDCFFFFLRGGAWINSH